MAEFIETQTEGRILTITMNRPGQLNCLNARACHELSGVWDEFIANDELWVAIITGAGPKAFCAGHDLAEVIDEPEARDGGRHVVDVSAPEIGLGHVRGPRSHEDGQLRGGGGERVRAAPPQLLVLEPQLLVLALELCRRRQRSLQAQLTTRGHAGRRSNRRHHAARRDEAASEAA